MLTLVATLGMAVGLILKVIQVNCTMPEILVAITGSIPITELCHTLPLISCCTPSQIRTDTGMFLRHVPLPLGYRGLVGTERIELTLSAYQTDVLTVELCPSRSTGNRTPSNSV